MEIYEGMTHCIYCGTPYRLEDKSPEVLSCSHCDKKHFIDPSVGCAGICFIDEQTILMIRRGSEPFKGTLDFPAGFVSRFDDSLEDALKREVIEETGAQLRDIKYLCSFQGSYQSQGHNKPHVSTYFTCWVENPEEVQASSDAKDIEIIKLEDVNVDEIGFEVSKKALKVLLLKS